MQGKRRILFLPYKLCKSLKKHVKNKKIARLAVFITPSKKPVDASDIRKEMKNLTEYVKISKKKIFLYNFRYFFHVCFILLLKIL